MGQYDNLTFMKEHLDLAGYMQLSKQLQSLTESEITLNSFIIKHFEEIHYYGIIDLAQKAKVSKATIGRYLNKLGYTGYSEFKTALKNNLRTHNVMVAPIEASRVKNQSQDDSIQETALRYISNVTQLIQQFSDELDCDALKKLAKMIAEKQRTIYVVGSASSRALATHFSTLLKYSRTEVVLLPLDKAELPKALLGVSQQDILIAFSYYRFNPVVLEVTKYFNGINANVVVISNTHSNPYGIYSDMQFILPSDVDSIFHSRTIGFLFIELLLYLLQKECRDHDNFEDLETLFKFFGTYSCTE